MPDFSEIYEDAQSSVKAAIAATLEASGEPFTIDSLLHFSESGEGEFLSDDGIVHEFKLMSRIEVFAEDVEFAEGAIGIADPDTLAAVQSTLQLGVAGKITALKKVEQQGDAFMGFFEQYINPRLTKRFAFKFDSDTFEFEPLNSEKVSQFSEEELFEFAPAATKTAGKKLNCKIEQCGGRCLKAGETCRQNMTPAQKQAHQKAIAAAKKAAKSGTPQPAVSSSPAPSPTPAPTPAPQPTKASGPIKTNQPELDKSRADLEKRLGTKAVEAAEKNVQRILNDDDTGVFIRIGSTDTLEKVLGDRFRTSAELGIDTHSIPNLKGGYQTARNRVEAKVLGYDEKATKADERPIYGYLGSKDLNGDSHANVSQAYGSIAVRLKPEAKERATFTGADSFKSGIASEVKNDGTPPPPNAASLVSTTRHGYDRADLPKHYPSYMKDDSGDGTQLREAAKAKNIDELVPKLATTGNAYMEAQVHGGVKPQDIAEIHFTPRSGSDRPSPAVAQFAKDNSVDLYVNGKKTNPDDILAPKSKTKDLNDAIDRGDFSEVLKLSDEINDSADNLKLSSGESDRRLKALFIEAGYDGKPKVASDQDVTDAWQNGGTLMVRGVNAGTSSRTEFADQFKTGDYFTGNGIYGNGTYVSAANGVDAKNAQDALKAIRKHGYSKASGVTMRMALPSDANVTDDKQFSQEHKRIKNDFEQWVKNERSQLNAANPGSSAFKKEASAFQKSLDTDNASVSLAGNTSNKQYGALRGMGLPHSDVYDVTIPHRNSNLYSQNLKVRLIQDLNGYRFQGPNGNIAKLKARTQGAAIKELAKLQAEAFASAVTGATSTSPALQAFDARIRRTRELLFGGTGGTYSERLAVIRGYDAIRLTQSYEPKHFMLLLNRSRLLVQDTEIAYRNGLKQVGG